LQTLLSQISGSFEESLLKVLLHYCNRSWQKVFLLL